MDLRALQAFDAVARHGGFSAAARMVGLTQPALSKAIRQLEDEVGGALLVRSSWGVRTTDLGEVVLRRARAMLAEREALFGEIAALKNVVRGRLRLGLPRIGSAILFAPLMAEFRARYPGVTIELQENGSRVLQGMVQAGELDLAVSLRPIPADLAWLGVRDDPLVALLPPGHPLAGRKNLKLADLADAPFLLFEAGFALNEILAAAFARRGLALREAARSGQPDFIVALVSAGVGIALMPKLVADRNCPPGMAASLLDDDDLRWTAGLVWRADRDPSPAAAAWLALVREHVARDGG